MIEPIKVAADLESLEIVSQYISKAVQLARLDNKKGYRLLLAADELVTNIINHGYEKTGKTGNISVAAEVDEKERQLRIAFEDDAPCFNPNHFELPDLSLPLEMRPVGGLGLFLIHQNVDHLQYQRVNDINRTVLTVMSE